MATLLVALAVMSVLMSAVLPAWRHQAQREKEAELVFRGEQYVRAIQLWERKMGPGSRPPNIDMLVQQKFLRKKYKDPMTEDGEFQPVFAELVNRPTGAGAGPRRRGGQPQPATAASNPADAGQIAGGGIHGVIEQEQGNVDPDLQGRDSLQRVAIHPRRRGDDSRRPRWQPVPGGPGGRAMPGGIDGGRRGIPPGAAGGRGGPGGRGMPDGRGVPALRPTRRPGGPAAAAAGNSNPRAIALVARTRFRRPRKGRGADYLRRGTPAQSCGTAETAIALMRQQSICRAVLIAQGQFAAVDVQVRWQSPRPPHRASEAECA